MVNLLKFCLVMKVNEFDFSTLLIEIRKSKKSLLRNSIIAFVLGTIVAFSIPKEYVSSCVLAPESQEIGISGGGLSSLASIAGINMGSGTDAIGPDLYPDVVSSNDFVVDLLYVDVVTENGDKCTFYDYLKYKSKDTWWVNIFKGIGSLLDSFTSKSEKEEEDRRINPEFMSRKEENLVKGLKSTIQCGVNAVDGTIGVSVRTQDPIVAKIMVDTVVCHLQSFITSYRTSKARNDLEYYRKLEMDSEKKYIEAQKKYAEYCDTHFGTVLQAYQTKRESLENDLSVALQSYIQMKQHVQLAEAKVQEKTPAFTMIEKASVPNRHVAPKKMIIMFSCVFLTLVFNIGWIYVSLLFPFLRKK